MSRLQKLARLGLWSASVHAKLIKFYFCLSLQERQCLSSSGCKSNNIQDSSKNSSVTFCWRMIQESSNTASPENAGDSLWDRWIEHWTLSCTITSLLCNGILESWMSHSRLVHTTQSNTHMQINEVLSLHVWTSLSMIYCWMCECISFEKHTMEITGGESSICFYLIIRTCQPLFDIVLIQRRTWVLWLVHICRKSSWEWDTSQ